MKNLRLVRRPVGLLSALTLLAVTSAYADVAFISGGTSITSWDTVTNTTSFVVGSADGGQIDSLLFDGSGNLLYSIIGTNNIGKYNLTTHSNTILSTGGNLNGVADMALDPGGTTFLVSNAFGNTIDRVDDTTGAKTTLFSGQRPDGLAYDNKGDLFAVLGLNEVAQLDPVTGAILKTIATPNAPDGLTFDATTGKLYVSSDGGGFYTIDTGLTSAPFTSVAGSPVFDGIASNGNTLYFVIRNQSGVQYDLTTGAITVTSPLINLADDIAPVSGPGSQVPEPRGLVLIGMGLLGVVAVFRRKVAQ